MQYANVTQQLSVGPQVLVDDIEAIQAAGFNSIICNRPDGEGADQPDFAEIEAKALSLGLSCIYQPVVSGKITPDDAITFEANLQKLDAPVLAYCRTGTRCITLWAMTATKTLSYEAILSISQKAGYDLSGTLLQVKPA
ncbi:TIGR01244 family sulfur transferase [Alteromonas sp. S167]|uniref:TIGR01244 family sulfur transferase n=1 Tax=Alteromonas sp. S167 TaxID=3117402 RepID=UPI002FE03E3E